jgi:hypothetical protein
LKPRQKFFKRVSISLQRVLGRRKVDMVVLAALILGGFLPWCLQRPSFYFSEKKRGGPRYFVLGGIWGRFEYWVDVCYGGRLAVFAKGYGRFCKIDYLARLGGIFGDSREGWKWVLGHLLYRKM